MLYQQPLKNRLPDLKIYLSIKTNMLNKKNFHNKKKDEKTYELLSPMAYPYPQSITGHKNKPFSTNEYARNLQLLLPTKRLSRHA